MQKTVKKSKKEGSGKRLSYIVTENGLVENDENVSNNIQGRKGYRRESNSRSLISSITEVADAKQKFKALSSGKNLNLQVRCTEDAVQKEYPATWDQKAALAEINAAEAEGRRTSLTIADIADTKRILGTVPKRKNSLAAPNMQRDTVEDLRRANAENGGDEVGLLEADAIRKSIQNVRSALQTSKAIAIMGTPRRHRKELLKSVNYLEF